MCAHVQSSVWACASTCVQAWVQDLCTGMCPAMGTDMCTGLCADMCTGMRTGMCTGVWPGMRMAADGQVVPCRYNN